MDMERRLARYSAEVRDRAVRMVLDHENEYRSRWAAISSIAEKIGCASETLRRWVKVSERNGGSTPSGEDASARLKALERENRELRQANEIRRKACASRNAA